MVFVHLGIFKVHESLWICAVTSAGDGFEGFCVRVVLEGILGTRSLFQRTSGLCAGIPACQVPVRKGDQLVGTGGPGSQHTDRTVAAAGHAGEAGPAPARGPPEGAPAAGVHIPYPRCFLQPCGGLEGATGPGSTRVPSCTSAGPGSRPRTGTCHLIRLSSVCLFVVQVPFSLAFSSLCRLLGPLPPGDSASSDPSPSCQPGSSGVGWLASPGQSWEALLRPDG